MPFEIGGEKHSKETVEAMNEDKQVVKNPSIGKTYSNANELMNDLIK